MNKLQEIFSDLVRYLIIFYIYVHVHETTDKSVVSSNMMLKNFELRTLPIIIDIIS